MDERKVWNKYWEKASEKKSFLGSMFTFYRKQVFARAVSYYAEKYFPKKGTFAECGSGSSQASIRLKKHNRTFIAVDISEGALAEAKKIPVITKTVQADIRKLPFKDKSIEGIWNLGVMEHFSEKDIQLILKEFKRVLKDDGTMILFWPPTYGPAHKMFELIERAAKLFGKHIQFFPDEPAILHSKKEAIVRIEKAGLYCKTYFNFRDLFSHVVVVVKKKPFKK